jgi:hypothetical protein
VTIRRSGWEMTEGRAVNPLLISCSVTAVVSYVALVYLVTMERLEDPGLWTLEAVERLYDFANLLSDPPTAFERLSDFLPENEFLECTTVSVGKVPVW